LVGSVGSVGGIGSEIANRQYAALPWRLTGDRLEILLITTLTTKRWMVPKGWPVNDCSPSECAAIEAFEEAGVVGTTSPKAVGSFDHVKQRKAGGAILCHVDVFALEVERQRRTWPEKAMRETCWCSVEEAVARVSEPGLKRLIAKFARKQAQLRH